MTTQIPRTVLIGDLVAAAFDQAVDYETDPVKISALATRAVTHILWQSRSVAHEASTHQKTRIGCGGPDMNVRPLEGEDHIIFREEGEDHIIFREDDVLGIRIG